jgi:hypothetical protein
MVALKSFTIMVNLSIKGSKDGSLKYDIEYIAGVAKNSEKAKKDSDYLDALEKNKGKIADPEKTGTIW